MDNPLFWADSIGPLILLAFFVGFIILGLRPEK